MEKEELLQSLEKNIHLLKEKHNLDFTEIISILEKREEDKKSSTLPLSIFKNNYLSALETIVKYLKEDLNLNYREIATLLNRNYDPIAITFRNSRRKMSSRLDISSIEKIPISIFRNLHLSILENLTTYLKDRLSLTYHQISILLNRDDRTIWTVYHRALKKNENRE